MTKKVYVAMSGGVDSSVAAALLKEQGYSVVGVFMKFWSPAEGDSPLGGTVPGVPGGCIWKEERHDALRVAAKLGIPLLTWDFTHEYEKKVVAYMLEAYMAGVTPNPDIMCNKEIKFGLFFEKAIAEGADYVATGHYARTQKRITNKLKNEETNLPAPAFPDLEEEYKSINSSLRSFEHSSSVSGFDLYQAIDKNKDQSYFLYTLEQRHLERTLFPIGGYTKPEVRELARKFDLPVAEKKDSHGVCFIGPLKMKEFLKDYIKPKKGKVILVSSRQPAVSGKKLQTANSQPQTVLGSHDGAWYYTIGQRHGIDLKLAGGPYYVIGKDIKNNIVYVGDESMLYSNQAQVRDICWIGDVPELPAKIGVKIRYRSQTVPAAISRIKGRETLILNSNFLIRFDVPVKSIAPGQAAVFYDGEKVLGGGIIR